MFGNLLDGIDGVPGQRYRRTIHGSPSISRVLYLPIFAVAPGQPVNVPVSSNGIPLMISEGSNVLTLSLTVQYDTNLLQITGVTLGSSLPAGWTLTNNFGVPGACRYRWQGQIQFWLALQPCTIKARFHGVPRMDRQES